MYKKLLARISVVFTFAAVAVASSVATADAAPVSPGACNMLHGSPNGFQGMLGASAQGLQNMIDLILASEAAGCPL